MNITEYFRSTTEGLKFTEQQSSHFAKSVAGDFNPLHDVGAKRFCVPGDLLFAILLSRYGAYSETAVDFSGMLAADGILQLPAEFSGALLLTDQREREVLSFSGWGEKTTNTAFVNRLVEQYVCFSGRTFPDLLVPLMRDAAVMINPDRPLVIYKDMALRLKIGKVARLLDKNDTVLQEQIVLLPDSSVLKVNGKKGVVQIGFRIELAGESIGSGEKNFVLSGLRDYEEQAMQGVVDTYNKRKSDYIKEVCDAV